MKLSFVFSLVTVSAALTGCLAIKSLVFPQETSTSYVELIPQKPLSLSSFSLCVRFATELSGRREIVFFAYRIQNADELNLWREVDGRLSFYLNGDGVFFTVPDIIALQTHLCVTWDSKSGAAALFLNGRKTQTKIYKKGYTTQSGGRVLLGQDPDSFLGNFDSRQSFVGEIFDVNLWDFVLSDSNIQDVFNGKRVERANVIDWETTELRVNGQVEVINVKL